MYLIGSKMRSGTVVLKHEWTIQTKRNTLMKGFDTTAN